ncbi:MAG: hypothetical protein R2738_04120 [Bacteroides graminisolvens]
MSFINVRDKPDASRVWNTTAGIGYGKLNERFIHMTSSVIVPNLVNLSAFPKVD